MNEESDPTYNMNNPENQTDKPPEVQSNDDQTLHMQYAFQSELEKLQSTVNTIAGESSESIQDIRTSLERLRYDTSEALESLQEQLATESQTASPSRVPNEEINHRFSYHEVQNTELLDTVRLNLEQVAGKLAKATPAGREQSLALTKLEEAMFWANAAIARNEESS